MKFRVLTIDTTKINERGIAIEAVLTLDRRGAFRVGERARFAFNGTSDPDDIVVTRVEGKRVWIALPLEVLPV